MISERENRWEYYVKKKDDEFKIFWKNRLNNNKKILFILGWGFDPRMCLGIEKFSSLNGNSQISCMVIEYGTGKITTDKTILDFRTSNMKKLDSLLNDTITKNLKTISSSGKSTPASESRKITQLFSSIADFNNCDDIVVDISSLPVNLYFPLLARILDILDKSETPIPNLHIIAAENQELDRKIKEIEIEDRADYLFSLASDLGKESNKKPHVWIPFLGENSDVQLKKISALVNPVEICPLIPSPSKNPRRGDNLLFDYMDLFEQLEIEIRNFIYGDEQNPFEAYRQIMDTIYHYPKILSSKGGCKIAISVLTSKLLSIAALLVAYECKIKGDLSVGIAHTSGKHYVIDTPVDDDLINNTELFSLWIAGSCYEH